METELEQTVIEPRESAGFPVEVWFGPSAYTHVFEALSQVRDEIKLREAGYVDMFESYLIIAPTEALKAELETALRALDEVWVGEVPPKIAALIE